MTRRRDRTRRDARPSHATVRATYARTGDVEATAEACGVTAGWVRYVLRREGMGFVDAPTRCGGEGRCPTPRQVTCPCGVAVTTVRANQRYCSADCYVAARRGRHRLGLSDTALATHVALHALERDLRRSHVE